MKEYKGLKVIRKEKKREANASYNRFTKQITIYDKFYKLSKVRQESILEHEYSHHVWYKIPMLYQKLWGYISNGKLTKLLNIMGVTTHTKNAYVTDYAKTKVTEDFAECVETKYLFNNSEKYKGKRFGTFADTKMQIANSMYNYFSNK